MRLTPEQRRKLHIASETAALALALPLSVYAAASPRLPGLARVGFGLVSVGTAVVDSVLLRSYLRRRNERNNTDPPAGE